MKVFPRLRLPALPRFSGWKTVLHPRRWEEGRGTLVNILWRLGGLLLMVLLLAFIIRVFRDQGYVIEPFSVPEDLAASGYDGAVVARKLQDEVTGLKDLASSVKADSVQLGDNQGPELEVAVLGIGLSLRSISYHLREIFGRSNKLVRGEIIRLNDTYTLTLRMTGFPTTVKSVRVVDSDEKTAVEQLLRMGGEVILSNTDPYRLAVVCYREKRFDEALHQVRRILSERPREAHWAYLAWGSVLDEQQDKEGALEKFRRAVELDPDFDLAWTRLAWIYQEKKDFAKATACMRKAIALSGNESRFINLGWMLHQQQEFAAADSAFEAASRKAPGNPQIWMSWADSKLSRRDTSGLAEIIRHIDFGIQENAPAYLMRAMIAIQSGDTMAAVRHAFTALEIAPDNPGALQVSMNASLLLKDYARIIRIYHTADLMKVHPMQRQGIENVAAMAYNLEGRHDSAFHLIRQAIAINPRIGYPYSTLGETFYFTGRRDSFYYYFEKALVQGMGLEMVDTLLPPYPQAMKEKRFRELWEKYGRQ